MLEINLEWFSASHITFNNYGIMTIMDLEKIFILKIFKSYGVFLFALFSFTPFMLSGPFYHNSLDQSISNSKVSGCFFYYYYVL